MRGMWTLLLLAAIASANTIPDEVITLTFNDPLLEEPAKMDVHINAADETIRFHMADQGNLGDVDTIEDYSVGFAASRVDDEDACYIRKLTATLEESAAQVRELAKSGPQDNQENLEILAIPAEEDEEFGSRIAEHCGNLDVYKLVKTEEDIEAEARDDSEANAVMSPERETDEASLQSRQVSVVFRRCFIFFFWFKCITTTITIPTGTTIIFFFG